MMGKLGYYCAACVTGVGIGALIAGAVLLLNSCGIGGAGAF